MSMVIIPHISWTILLTAMVDPTSQGRACSSTGRGWDVWLLLRLLAISANPSGGVHCRAQVLSCGVSTLGFDMAIPANLDGGFHLCIPGLPGGIFSHWVKIFSASVFWLERSGVFAVEGMVSFECPMPLVGPMPLILVLQFLRGQWLSGFHRLGGVIHTQFEGSTSLKTWVSVKVVNGSIHSLNSLMHSASWHDLPNGMGLAK